MKCMNCGNDLPDGARFCPFCGAENDLQQGPTGSGGGENQTTGQGLYTSPAPYYSIGQDSGLFVKIGAAILAVLYIIFGIGTIIGGFRTLYYMMSYHYFSPMGMISVVPVLVKGICYIGMAAVLAMIGFARKRDKAKQLFTTLGILGIVIVVIALISMILSMIINIRYLNIAVFGILFRPLIGTVATLGIMYGLLYLAKEAPTTADYMNAGSVSDMLRDCADAVQGAAQDVAADMGAKAGNAQFAGQGAAPDYHTGGMNTSYQNNNMQNYPNVTPLKTDRGLLGYILLSIITCGIYGYYFIYSVARDVNIACAGDGKKTGGLLKLILLSIVTCGIYSWWWQYALGNRLAENAPRYGMSFQENGTTILLWDLFGCLLCGIGPFIAMNIIIKNTNSICMAYNRSKGLV